MVIVLIHWRIKPEMEHEFLEYWRTTTTVPDRTGLITEMLSEVNTPKDFSYITWTLDPESLGNFKSYVNVGIWSDSETFFDQIGKNFNDDLPMKEFEQFRRRRIVLTPQGWRRGSHPLPGSDSLGTI